ncbi:MAG: glycosyltransferase [Dermatophilaceae bacterium]
MKHVEVDPKPIERLASLLTPERAAQYEATAAHARELLKGRKVWNVNATATGGGVAEMLQTLHAYWLGAGIDAYWLVLRGVPDFFTLTKRIHNVLHGEPGDGGPLKRGEHRIYEQVLADNLESMVHEISPGDIMLLHDPQTAGLVEGLKRAGAKVIWRCHIGRDTTNKHTDRGWSFLRPYIEHADAFVFSRSEYVPDWVPQEKLAIIPPAIDPFSAKNQVITPADVVGILVATGLILDGSSRPAVPFTRRDGRTDVVRHHSGLLADSSIAPKVTDRLVLQVSRWDKLKDMPGVMKGFVDHVADMPPDVHLMLAGPEVSGVSDDPEGALELAACIAQWRDLPDSTRRRVHLASLPMDDTDENAVIVNALQRHAYLVVQKSLFEGFGLTVTEAMWKGRPVVASAVGGIQDQVEDGVDGILLRDPTDLDEYATALKQLLDDPPLAERMGAAGHAHARDEFLGDRHLRQYIDLFASLLT